MAVDVPPGFTLALEEAPETGFRAELGQRINAFHAETVPPYAARRFSLALRDAARDLQAGLTGVLAWEWLYIDAVWVAAALRGQGAGRLLLARAEAHAVAAGCHSAWLDTFQARGFYLALGYEVFGALPRYPAGQGRYFLRKRLVAGLA